MLYQAIELRHAPFFLWIDDLSAPDRLFHFNIDSIPFMEPPYGIPVLTIIMGATMLLQQKMSPPMGDPTQAKDDDVHAAYIYGDFHQFFGRAGTILVGEQRSFDFTTILYSEKICLETEVVPYVFV